MRIKPKLDLADFEICTNYSNKFYGSCKPFQSVHFIKGNCLKNLAQSNAKELKLRSIGNVSVELQSLERQLER